MAKDAEDLSDVRSEYGDLVANLWNEEELDFSPSTQYPFAVIIKNNYNSVLWLKSLSHAEDVCNYFASKRGRITHIAVIQKSIQPRTDIECVKYA